jgi:hypothetical protein
MNVIVHKFATRHWAENAPHTRCPMPPAALEAEVQRCWDRRKPSDLNPAVMVVPINPLGFECPFVQLATGQEAITVFGERNKDFPDEGARMGTPRIVTQKFEPPFGQRVPAQVVEVICYPSSLLADEKDKEGRPNPLNQLDPDGDNWEIISINAEMMEGMPPNFRTILYNEWAGGGTPSGVDYTLAALTAVAREHDDPKVAEAVAKVRRWYDELIRSHQLWHDKASV